MICFLPTNDRYELCLTDMKSKYMFFYQQMIDINYANKCFDRHEK